ncbi:MAG: acyl-ACP--UDP-N-acetylglucosamine O-acyltransferase [Bacteroidia bacterium]|nr:acyl-ACP--UDP-N-acetylglucosamine O-acyltransferase [Bacteroidia bacterium]
MVHPLACIDPKARIGSNVQVDPFTFISGDVEIGDNTWIGSNVSIFDGARIGKNCKIFPGAVISAIPQDLKFKGEETTAIIGDHTTIRECVTINKGTAAMGRTEVGNNCLLMAYVHVAHDCILGNNVILANSVNLAGHVTIEDWAILEGYVGVSQFMNIGAHSFIGGQTGVRKNVPPFVKAAREPLSYAGINSVGLSRRGYSKEIIEEIQNIYRTIFQKGFNISKAIAMVEENFSASVHRDQILDFIKASEKGIIRGPVSSFQKTE